jgi:hypothetical protein
MEGSRMSRHVNDPSGTVSESQLLDFVSRLERMLVDAPDQFVQFTSDVADKLDLWAAVANGSETEWLEVMAGHFRSASENETMVPLRPPHLTSRDMLPRMTATGDRAHVGYVIEAYWREIFERLSKHE